MTRKEEIRDDALKMQQSVKALKGTALAAVPLGLIEIILELTEPESVPAPESQEELWKELIEDTRPFAEIDDEIERHKSKFHLTRKPL